MLEKLFRLKENGTSVRTEMIAGLSTFLTMSFIIAVNPGILSDSGIDFAAAFVATIIATVVGTLIMGLYAGWPVAVAPGMGLNAFFTYVVVLGSGFTWQQGLTAVFVSSVLFLLFSLTKIRAWLLEAIPNALQAGITAGIGLFLAMIGLTSAGIIVANPDTIIGLGAIKSPEVLLAGIGLVVIAGLEYRGVKGGILVGILIISVFGWALGLAPFSGIASAPPVASAAFALDFSAILSPAFLSIVFVMLFVDFFDTTGTLSAISEIAGKRRADGSIENINKAVVADTSASIVGALSGTSNMTTYLESAAGIKAGGRTGLTAVVIAALFASCLFFEPLFASIPAFATAPALIFVAANFLSSLKRVNWDDLSEAVSVMVIALIMPLTFSIAAGIAFGFLSFAVMKVIAGKAKEVSTGLWTIIGFAVIWIFIGV
ncbi:MAG: NCS2 family permease [Candidatus Puniceispirillaceae bacterium]